MLKKRLNKLKRKLVTVLSLAMVLSGFPVVPCEAEQANREVQIRLLLELVDEMVKNSLP